MATLAAAAARRASIVARTTNPSPATSFIPRRGLAGAADHHGPAKVNCWKEPMNPAQWKEEHFVIVSLSGWGLLIFGGYKLFSGGKKEEVLFTLNVSYNLVDESQHFPLTKCGNWQNLCNICLDAQSVRYPSPVLSCIIFLL